MTSREARIAFFLGEGGGSNHKQVNFGDYSKSFVQTYIITFFYVHFGYLKIIQVHLAAKFSQYLRKIELQKK